jgi:thioredoxin 1
MGIKAVTDSSFQDEVLSSNVPVLVDFWAQWCGPCRMMAPILDGIAEHYEGKLTVVKVDIDANPVLTESYSVRSIPSLSLIVDGTVVKQINGAKSKSALMREISDVIQTSPQN